MGILLSRDVFRNYQAQCCTVEQDLQRLTYIYFAVRDKNYSRMAMIHSNQHHSLSRIRLRRRA
jgi:hypothetical protein